MSASTKPGIRSPLQLFGLYLAWAETAIGGGLFATVDVDHWSRYFLMVVMGLGLLGYVSVAGFLLIYLSMKYPWFLFNPSDYDPAVQHRLFSPGPQVVVENPGVVQGDPHGPGGG